MICEKHPVRSVFVQVDPIPYDTLPEPFSACFLNPKHPSPFGDEAILLVADVNPLAGDAISLVAGVFAVVAAASVLVVAVASVAYTLQSGTSRQYMIGISHFTPFCRPNLRTTTIESYLRN